jgi:MSHA biogenesis protein MshP
MFCRHAQRGFSLPIAIFILVIMALLGAAMVTIMQNSQRSVGTAVLSTRAFFSAQSAAQYALGQLFPLNGGAANCPSTYPTITYTASGLAGCSAVVACSSSTISGKTFYKLNSTGTCDVSGNRAVRQIEMQARSP